MTEQEASRLYELADRIHGVARQIRLPLDLEPGPCTPVEITVMRFIHRNAGTSAGAAADATLLPSSNFSRVIRGLEAKGLVRREPDLRDERGVRLFITALAEDNFSRMRKAWSEMLVGIVADWATLEVINAALADLEQRLIARRNEVDEQLA